MWAEVTTRRGITAPLHLEAEPEVTYSEGVGMAQAIVPAYVPPERRSPTLPERTERMPWARCVPYEPLEHRPVAVDAQGGQARVFEEFVGHVRRHDGLRHPDAIGIGYLWLGLE